MMMRWRLCCNRKR